MTGNSGIQLTTLRRRRPPLTVATALWLDQDMYCVNQSSMGCGRRWNSR
jgi:hypothetical protein